MAAMTAVALSSSPLLPPLPSKSNPSPPPPPPPFPPLFHIPFPSPSPHIACSRLSSRPPPSTRFHHSISPKAAPCRPNRLLCRATEYKLPDPIPEFAAAETNKFRTHMLDRLTKKNEYFGDSFGEVVDTCTENNGLVSLVYNKPFPKPLHFNARNPLTRVGMSAGATSSSSSRRLHLYPPTFCSSNSLLSPNPPLLLSSLLPAAFRAPPLAVNYGRLGSASSKWGSDGFWEDPDDGNDSEPEEMDQEEEEEISSDEGEAEASAVDNDKSAMFQYEELVKEVELLLEPEERAILQKNEVPDVSKISTMKWNPFHSLALSGQIPFMDKLLEHGTEIDCLDKDGFTALHKAVIGKKEAVISHLLRKGANPHVRDRDGATPLHYAVQVGAMQTVKLLIKYKVDVNVADNDGWMPLHVAMQTRSREIAKVLLVNGADKTRRNKDGKTPLDLSLCFGKDFKSYELAKLLKLVPVNRDP